MLWTLAQTDTEQALTKGYWNLAFVALIGVFAVVLVVVMILTRRWKRRHLDAIERDKAARREGRPAERVDAWQASSQRYVDHDKLPDEGEDEDEGDDSGFDEEDDEDDLPLPGMNAHDPDEPDEERDPYGLFDDAPYHEPDDEDEMDEDDDLDDDVDDDDDDDDDIPR